jgi:hypothetical protein
MVQIYIVKKYYDVLKCLVAYLASSKIWLNIKINLH